MIQTTQLPLPKERKIIPEIVARWNRSKGRIDEMTRSLDSMNFTFTKGSAKQVLVMREFKKMAVNVGFILKHCFPAKSPTHWGGYSMIQRLNHKSDVTMKDVLYQLASSYKLMNPIHGVVPISPTCTVGESGIQHDAVDQKVENKRSTWYKEATKYIKERIKPESRYKLKKYIEDPTLNKI
jgi:hypothetical protein